MIQWQIQTVTGQQQQQHLMAPMYKHTTTFDTQCVTFDTRHCLPTPLTAAAHSSPAVDRQTDRETDKQTDSPRMCRHMPYTAADDNDVVGNDDDDDDG